MKKIIKRFRFLGALLTFCAVTSNAFGVPFGDDGHAGSDTIIEWQAHARRFLNYVTYADDIERSKFLGDRPLEDLVFLIKNVNVVKKYNLSPDELGNEEPIAKNYSYPYETPINPGHIEVEPNRWEKSKYKLAHVCHEYMGILGEDRSYQDCVLFFRKGQNILNEVMEEGFGCETREVYSLRLDTLYLSQSYDMWGDTDISFTLLYDGAKQFNYIYVRDIPPYKEFVLNENEVAVPDDAVVNGMVQFRIEMSERGAFERNDLGHKLIELDPNRLGKNGTFEIDLNGDKISGTLSSKRFCTDVAKNKSEVDRAARRIKNELEYMVSRLNLVHSDDAGIERARKSLIKNILSIRSRVEELRGTYRFNEVKSDFNGKILALNQLSFVNKNFAISDSTISVLRDYESLLIE